MADMQLTEFISFLTRAPVEVDHAVHVGLERAARLIEAEAKEEIGVYQGAAGPFQQWKELADATKADRLAHGYSENDPLLRSGEMRDSISHAVGKDEAVVGSNSLIAVYQELGTSRIPARSFLGGAAARKAGEVANILGHAALLGLVGGGQRIEIEG